VNIVRGILAGMGLAALGILGSFVVETYVAPVHWPQPRLIIDWREVCAPGACVYIEGDVEIIGAIERRFPKPSHQWQWFYSETCPNGRLCLWDDRNGVHVYDNYIESAAKDGRFP
jgi:hypothetical protein